MKPFEKSVTQDRLAKGGMGFSFDAGTTFGTSVRSGTRLEVPAQTMLALYELAEEFRSTVLRAEELGFSTARHAGMEMATDTFIQLTDEQIEDPELRRFQPYSSAVAIEDKCITFKTFDEGLTAQVAAYVEMDEIETYLRDVGLLPGGTPRM